MHVALKATRTFPKITRENRRLPKSFEKDRKTFRSDINTSKYNNKVFYLLSHDACSHLRCRSLSFDCLATTSLLQAVRSTDYMASFISQRSRAVICAVTKILAAACRYREHFQARGHSFSLYGPALSPQITGGFLSAINWLIRGFLYATLF